ncbi:MAG: hypothetical protein ABI818_04245 [Acidobacteriota bacterium]
MSLLLGGVVALGADPGAGTSSKAASELVALMKSRNLDAIAAPDPEQQDRFVAALLIPDVQLLVVGATTTAPAYLQSQLAQHLYRDAYSTLQSAAVLKTKLFFQDMGSDGLTEGGSLDIMYEHGTEQTVFDGDWKRQKISKAAYDKKLQKADADYAKMLQLLIEALRAAPGAV